MAELSKLKGSDGRDHFDESGGGTSADSCSMPG